MSEDEIRAGGRGRGEESPREDASGGEESGRAEMERFEMETPETRPAMQPGTIPGLARAAELTGDEGKWSGDSGGRIGGGWWQLLGLNLLVWIVLAGGTALVQGLLGRANSLHMLAILCALAFTGVSIVDGVLQRTPGRE